MADTSKITLGQLKTALTQAKNYTDNEIAGVAGISKVEPETSDMPKVFFNGGKPTTKDSVYATMEYISKTEHFKGYVDIKCQGTSSMAYPKKNYTIKMFSDETMTTKLKKDFKGWGKQSKFCLKANYIDHSHARNVVSAKLWGQVVESRSDFDTLPEELKTSPNYGAVNGFPIKLYYNGTYEGVYTWNIPKDGWMNNMDDKLNTHCILCSEEYNSGCFRRADATLWSDELHDTMPANIATSFNNFQYFVINSTDEEFKTGLSTYANVNSLIDYYIFQYVICGLDSMGKNQLFFTYDGIKWIASSYDMDSTFGIYWDGKTFVSATYRMQEDYESMTNGRQGNLLYIRMEQLFYEEIAARYAELRAGVLSYANIVNEFERFMDVIGKDLYAEDLKIYTKIPSGSTNNIKQIRDYTRDRLAYVDEQIASLGLNVPCTSITLNKTELALGSAQNSDTLIATVEPSNTTDTVVWSVNPAGIVTMEDGLVTAVSNGEAVITVTCGTQTATCNVSVTELVINTLAYDLAEPLVCDGSSTYLDTNMQLFNNENVQHDWTMLIDFTPTSFTTGTVAYPVVLHCMKESDNYPGLALDISNSGGCRTTLPNNTQRTIKTINTNDRTKLVFKKVNNTITVYDNLMIELASNTVSSINTTDKTLILGAFQQVEGKKGRFFTGTIHNFKLTENEMSIIDCLNWMGTEFDSTDLTSVSTPVFKVDSTCLNTEANTLTDAVAGISATLAGTPTISDNQIAFTENDTFDFDISSLNLGRKNFTFRIKITPTTLDNKYRNIFALGLDTSYNNTYTGYAASNFTKIQFGGNGGTTTVSMAALIANTESEIIISVENITHRVVVFKDGELIQSVTLKTLYVPLRLSNLEGSSRFIGKYSLIEVYHGFTDNYIALP